MFKKFLLDTSGNFAIMFSVCATALVMSVAAAIDISGMYKQRSDLQYLTDAAALAAASLRTDNTGEIQKAAKAAVEANNTTGERIDVDVTIKNEIIQVTATKSYSTMLMGVIGKDELPVSASTKAPIPEENPVNIALVLDSTGSMAGSNMDALKSASKHLLDIFSEADPGLIQAGVVPYNKWVNVGMVNRNRSWMDVPDDESYVDNRCYMTKDLVDSTLCYDEDYTRTCRNDSGEYDCSGTRRVCPAEAYGPEYEVCRDYNITVTWNGCVTSREDPFQFEPAYNGKKFEGVMNVSCGTEILDLTPNLTEVSTHIDSLVASGNTYIPAGLVWGWRMLEPSEPFGGLTNSEAKRKRALVLMTDGSNTVYNDVNSNHADAVRPEETDKANDYTKQLCKNIKDAGIDVYTVAYQLGTGDTTTQTMIQECASAPDFFFPADNAEDLEEAFEKIAESLFEIRILD